MAGTSIPVLTLSELRSFITDELTTRISSYFEQIEEWALFVLRYLMAQETYDQIFTNVADDLTLADNTTVINVTGETGLLVSIAMVTTTAVSGPQFPTSRIEVTVDGQPLQSISTWAGASDYDNAGIRPYATNGNGGAANSSAALYFGGVRYGKSLKVTHNVTAASSAGAIRIACQRAKRI